MKCCVSTDVKTWTNWLTFEPYLGHSPDAGTGLLYQISYRLRNFATLSIGCQRGALLRGIFTSGPENHTYTYWRRAARASRTLKWLYSVRHRKTFVGGKCALSSALLVNVYNSLGLILSDSLTSERVNRIA